MSNAFDSRSETIGALLNAAQPRTKIVVPKFQRGYSWEQKHVKDFCRDILTYLGERDEPNGPANYFLGPIVAIQKFRGDLILLDGQQRLATSTILFSVLRDHARRLGTSESKALAERIQITSIERRDGSYTLQLGQLDEGFFRDTVQLREPISKTPTIRSHQRIQKAKKIVSDVINKYLSSDKDEATKQIQTIWEVTLSEVVTACIPVEKDKDAYKIFETLNDRGLRLSAPDLLLNFLMGETESTPETQKTIRQLWDEMLLQMGRNDINYFLRHLWVSKYGDLKSNDLFSALRDRIKDPEKPIEPIAFVRDCSAECVQYVALIKFDASLLGVDAATHVRSLVEALNTQAALPALLSSFIFLTAADFAKTIQYMLVFVVRHSVVSGLDSSELESTLYSLAREIRAQMSRDKEDVPDPQDRIKEKSKQCLSFIKKTLHAASPDDKRTLENVKSLILEPDDATYLLERTAQSMETKTREIVRSETNLEHIYPRNPAPAQWGGQTNQEKLAPFTWHIGNLTMIGKRLNESLRNGEYPQKRPSYEAASELAMVHEIAKLYTDWSVENIQDRASRLAKRVVEIWSFDNPSRV